MTKKWRQILGALVSLAVLCVAILGTARLLARPDSEDKYYDFFHETQEFDVLLMGNSHMLNGVFPMQLWKDYGITSYNFGGHSATVGVSYWVLRNAVEYHKPKVVVLDVYGVLWNDTETMDANMAHISFDAFPLTATKVQGLRELFSDSEAAELMFPFSVYHNRWQEMTISDWKSRLTNAGRNLEKGAESRINVAVPKSYVQIPEDQMSEEENGNTKDLRRMIRYCQENSMEIVLLNIPSPISEKYQERANYIQKIAEEYGIDYLNLPYENLIDFDTDLYDSNSHLNPAGAYKVTDYLGEYLQNQFELVDKREDSEYNQWREDFAVYYENIIKENILSQKRPDTMLMLLAQGYFAAEVRIVPDTVLTETEEKLLRNSGAEVSRNSSLELAEADLMIRIYENSEEEPLCTKYFRKNGGEWELLDS